MRASASSSGAAGLARALLAEENARLVQDAPAEGGVDGSSDGIGDGAGEGGGASGGGAAAAADGGGHGGRRPTIPESDLRIMREERAGGGRGPAPLDEDTAERLERVWAALETPLREKLGLLVKFSAAASATYVARSVEVWEAAVAAVRAREQALGRLAAHVRAQGETPGGSDLFLKEQLAKATAAVAPPRSHPHTLLLKTTSLMLLAPRPSTPT